MAAREAQFTLEQLARGIKRLGRERLREECENRLDKPREGKKWGRMPARELASELARQLSAREAEGLAVEGMQKQRAPSVGGPSWRHEDDKPLNASRAQEAVAGLPKRLPGDWTEVKTSLGEAGMLLGIVNVEYVSRSLQPTIGGLVWIPSRNSALILLDYEDQISTISARSDRDALTIGAAWARVLGTEVKPVQLTVSPSLEHGMLSYKTMQMLEAVYGRIGMVAKIVIVDRIRTERQERTSPVRWQTARGEDDNVLDDDDVRSYLKRGDDIVGLRFHIDWTYASRGEERHYYSNARLLSNDDVLVLHVTRGGQSLKRASELYVELRRALLRAETDPAGIEEVEGVIAKVEDVIAAEIT